MRLRFIRVCLLLTILICIPAGNVFGQDTERPLPPLLELVSVDPSNGHTTLSWSPGGSPDVAGYVFYIFRDGAGEAFDTLYSPLATVYTDITSNAGLFSVTYLVAAIDSSDNISPLSNPLSTIFIGSELDTCQHGISVRWSKYEDENHTVDYYELYFAEGGSLPDFYDTTEPDDTSLFIPGLVTGTEYCFTVKASINGDRISSSNKTCTAVTLETPPGWINGNYATIEEGNLVLSFSFDQASEINRFRVYESISASGAYTPITDLVSSSGTVGYEIAPAPAQRKFYRLAAINSCDQPVIYSNPVSPIILNITSNENTIFLVWDTFIEWQGGVDHYSVYRNEGPMFNEIGQTTRDTRNDNVSDYM
ncbi:MAG: fibronectin type III domain-containing protein [Bacteroidales bacterium]